MEKLEEPIELEVEKYTEEDYDEMLNELYGPINIGCLTFDPSEILSNLDPIAYNCGFSDYQEYETKYKCPICDLTYEEYELAKFCCQEEIDEDEDEVIID